MNNLSFTRLIILIFILLIGCKDREPLNPLDPNNPATHGQAYTIKAEVTGIGKVKVHWKKVNQSQVKGYRLYRTIHGAEPSFIAKINDTLFLNTGLQPGITCSYFYRLVWEDAREIHQSPTTTPIVTFNLPTGLTITKQSRDRVEMQWNDLQWLDNYAYCRIYRNSDSTFYLYDSTSNNQYIDTNVDIGITYRYKVAAVAADGTHSNLSEEGYATPGNNSPVIDSLKASQPFTNWGEEVTVTCYAHDEDGDPIAYSWEALEGGIIIVSGETITFQVPQDSQFVHRIKVMVSDSYSMTDQDTIVIESSDKLLYEDFEDNVLDSKIAIQTVGTFNSAPSINNISNFGSTKAFGFGLSTCGLSCFDNYVTKFIITFTQPTYISKISFKEMELYDNWGSLGEIYLDDVLTNNTFGRFPSNDGHPDVNFRQHDFPINKSVKKIELRVRDITSSSEIFIDDLSIHR